MLIPIGGQQMPKEYLRATLEVQDWQDAQKDNPRKVEVMRAITPMIAEEIQINHPAALGVIAIAVTEKLCDDDSTFNWDGSWADAMLRIRDHCINIRDEMMPAIYKRFGINPMRILPVDDLPDSIASHYSIQATGNPMKGVVTVKANTDPFDHLHVILKDDTDDCWRLEAGEWIRKGEHEGE